MNNLNSKLENIFNILQNSSKKTLVCLSTTANVNNPNLYIGSIRETSETIAANFIFKNIDNLQDIISFFDGKIDCFLIDCEIKNEVSNLVSQSLLHIKKTPYHFYKPNDFAIEALDILIENLLKDLTDIKIAVLGFGNIGGKIALKLAERGAKVYAYDINQERLKIVANALNELKRGLGFIIPCSTTNEACINASLVVGCTAGIPVIDKNEINLLTNNKIIIDAGNGTISKEAIKLANEKGVKLICLSPEAGYAGYITALEKTEKQLLKMKTKKTRNNQTLIGVGIIGADGNILVDDVDNPTKIIGVCNGLGDILTKDYWDIKLEDIK